MKSGPERAVAGEPGQPAFTAGADTQPRSKAETSDQRRHGVHRLLRRVHGLLLPDDSCAGQLDGILTKILARWGCGSSPSEL